MVAAASQVHDGIDCTTTVCIKYIKGASQVHHEAHASGPIPGLIPCVPLVCPPGALNVPVVYPQAV